MAKNIAIITSQGGHLGQMKLLFTKEVIRKDNCILITEDLEPKVKKNSFLGEYTTYFFKKDVLLKPNPITYLSTLFRLMNVLKKEKIEIIFTNGAQISIPAVIAGRLLGIKTVFIDTVIRVKTPNWSAKACYPFADLFWVQHEAMAKKYGRKAKYVGGIV
jgi:UDP-N-acetylglucosamine:LPS N-acetylglucosamine transferase